MRRVESSCRSAAQEPRRSPRSAVFAALCLGSLAALAPASAQTQAIDPTVEIRVDYFEPDFETTLRLDSSSLGIGTSIDLEDDLLMEGDAQELRAELLFRTGERSRITLDYSAFEREGSATIDHEIQFGDVVYHASATVDSSFDSRLAAIGWRYFLVKEDAGEFGFSISVAWVELEATLSGDASLPGGPVLILEESGDAEGPLPLLGLHGAWWLGGGLRLSGAVRYLEIDDFDGWSGSALEAGARLDWFLTQNIAVGAGYYLTELEADFEDGDRLGSAEYTYDGPRVGLVFAF
jgi:opacity protein-like surface antigen